VMAKIIMQQLWQSQVGWNESVPQNIHKAWYDFKDQLPMLNDLTYSRKVAIKMQFEWKCMDFAIQAKEHTAHVFIYVP
jgi:hypothetical protein